MASKVDNRNGHLNNTSETDIEKCYVCHTNCANRCDRCGELYCSIKCQQVDWKTHKYFCFKMPNLIMGEITGLLPTQNLTPNNNKSRNSVNINSDGNQNGLDIGFSKYHDKSYDKLSEKNSSSSSSSSSALTRPQGILHIDEPKNNEDVVLTWVCKANSYYIRSLETDGEYMQNAKDFNQSGRKAKILQQIPQRNEIVLARHEKKFVRAVVLNADDRKNIKVALVDTGAITNKILEDLRECSDDLVERKRHNFKIVVDDVGHSVPPMKWTRLVHFVRNKTPFRLHFDGENFSTGRNFRLFEKTGESGMDMLLKGLTVSKNNGRSEVSKPMRESALSVLLKDATASKNGEHSEVSKPKKESVLSVILKDLRDSKIDGPSEVEKPTKEPLEIKSTIPLAKFEERSETKNTVESSESSEKLEVKDSVESKKTLGKSEECLESTESLEQLENRLETKEKQEPEKSTNPIGQESQTDLTKPIKTFMKDLKFESFQEGAADIAILDTSAIFYGCISVIELKNVENLSDLHANIQAIANDLKEEYQPDENEICLAKFDEEWYRASFDKHESMFYLIDYGNCTSVERKDLRKLPLSLRHPCWTVSCHIEDFLKPSSEEKINEIRALITDRSFNNCKIKRVIVDGDVEVYITLQVVSDFLQKANN